MDSLVSLQWWEFRPIRLLVIYRLLPRPVQRKLAGNINSCTWAARDQNRAETWYSDPCTVEIRMLLCCVCVVSSLRNVSEQWQQPLICDHSINHVKTNINDSGDSLESTDAYRKQDTPSYLPLLHTKSHMGYPRRTIVPKYQNIPVIQNHICIYLKQTRVNSIWYRTTPECYNLMISRHFIYNYTYLSSKVVKTFFYTVIIVPWQSRELSD